MLTKQNILTCLQNLPERFSAEELIDRIILLEKVETGLEQARTGQVLTEEELDKRLGKWLD